VTEEKGWAIRPAELGDAEGIAGVYNEAVLTTVATFDTEPRSLAEQRRWLRHHGPRHPVLVATSETEVVGWSALSAWSDRKAYDGTGEVSVYVRADWRGRGVGRQLLGEIVARADAAGLHTVLARISAGNPVSVHLHEQVGFRPIGLMHEVGFKFGRWIDVELFQRLAGPLGTSPPSEPPAGIKSG